MNAPHPTIEPTFVRLSKVDVSKHIEKKGQFSYLSWPFAVSQLRQAVPNATWEVKRFNGLPYMQTDLGYFVEVSVSVDGIELSQIHPVLDGRNRPIQAPSPFDINTSIQRCLVKAIALHGLGLNIYAGEDLPLVEDDIPQEVINSAIKKRKEAAEKGLNAYKAVVKAEDKAVTELIPADIKTSCTTRAKQVDADKAQQGETA
jgi:hypothetical protein